ncbi:MAG: protein kinase [Deltaproteobacteria bacterium]|nr:protein kinase [Deltaproteobacteria bacterium]MBW2535183.1 protein kinase [Deltaproteobacteria bacterium]
MGEVWAATHTVTERRVALKFLTSARDASAEARQRFEREARAAGRVDHPNVVEVHDFFELDDGTPIMVLELLQGETLAACLDREGAIDVGRAADLMLPVVSAVGTAHARGVVHRDLKPDNIFLQRDPAGAERVKVLDFGIAKLRAPHPDMGQLETATGQAMGTPSYMAPEQCVGESVAHTADVWALGVVLYELLSGQLPVKAESYGQLVKRLLSDDIPPLASTAPEVPTDVADLVMGMLAREPLARPGLDQVAATLASHSSTVVPEFGLATTAPAPCDDSASPEAGADGEDDVRDGGADSAVGSDGTTDPEGDTKPGTASSFALGRTGAAAGGSSNRRSAAVARIGLGASLAALALLAWTLGRQPEPDEPAQAEPGRTPPSAPVTAPMAATTVDGTPPAASTPRRGTDAAPATQPTVLPRRPRPATVRDAQAASDAGSESPYGDEPVADHGTSPSSPSGSAAVSSPPPQPTAPSVIPIAPY